MDNIGFCYAWRNGLSKDLYIYNITKAVLDIARMVEVRLEGTMSSGGVMLVTR